jgi:hypothetical protein
VPETCAHHPWVDAKERKVGEDRRLRWKAEEDRRW